MLPGINVSGTCGHVYPRHVTWLECIIDGEAQKSVLGQVTCLSSLCHRPATKISVGVVCAMVHRSNNAGLLRLVLAPE